MLHYLHKKYDFTFLFDFVFIHYKNLLKFVWSSFSPVILFFDVFKKTTPENYLNQTLFLKIFMKKWYLLLSKKSQKNRFSYNLSEYKTNSKFNYMLLLSVLFCTKSSFLHYHVFSLVFVVSSSFLSATPSIDRIVEREIPYSSKQLCSIT